MFHSHDSTMSSSSFHGHRSSLFSGMIAVVLLGMIVYFGLLLPIQSPSSFSDPTSHCVSDVYMPEDYSRNVVHFASIALGIKAQFVARQLLISYLYNSDHNGTFHLITDSLPMFDNLSSVVPKNPNSKINFILITNGSLSNGLTMPEVQKLAVVRLGADFRLFWSPHSHEKRFRMRIKWLKSQMFKVIPEPDYLIFMDSDMVIGQSVVPFVDECLRLRKTPYGHSVVSLFTDLGHTGSQFHTGVIFWSRYYSGALLEKWGQYISSGEFPSDQRAIQSAIYHLRYSKLANIIAVNSTNRFFAFPQGDVIASRQPVTFFHLTTYRLSTSEQHGFTLPELEDYIHNVLKVPWNNWSGFGSLNFVDQEKHLRDNINRLEEEIREFQEAPFPKQFLINRLLVQIRPLKTAYRRLFREGNSSQEDFSKLLDERERESEHFEGGREKDNGEEG